MTTPTLTLTSAGASPTSPATLHQLLISGVAATNPGYTANLPGSLIEDISSTDVGAMVTCDNARVEAVNNLSPVTANPYILALQGQQYGLPQGAQDNSSVNVVFTGTVGYVIYSGFTVTDGFNNYVIQAPGGVIGSGGSSNPLTAVAQNFNTNAIPANSVSTIVTSVPAGIALTVTNPLAGVPGQSPETVTEYRAKIMQASAITGQGTPAYLLTLLQAVPGVNPRLVNILPASNGWEVICGGGDTYAVAQAIYQGTLDLTTIVGSQINPLRNIDVTLNDPPVTVDVVYVNPPQQVVTMTVTWNTNLPNFTNGLQVNALAQPALTNYINGIQVGKPINLLEMTNVFQSAVATVINPANVTTLVFAVYINAVLTPPSAGTSAINGDPESYFYAAPNAITVVQ